MAMITFSSTLVELLTNLQTYLVEKAAGLPDLTRQQIMQAALHPSPVERVVTTAEALYAIKSDLDLAGQSMCAQLASFAALNGWHGMQERGLQIAGAMQREAGMTAPRGQPWPSVDVDPAPLKTLLPADTAPPVPVPQA